MLEGSDKCEDARARGTAGGAAVGVQTIVALPDATYELGIPADPARVWHVSILYKHRTVSENDMI